MKKPNVSFLIILCGLQGGLLPAFAGEAFIRLEQAGVSAARTFDGAGVYKNAADFSAKGAPEASVTKEADPVPSKTTPAKKAWQAVKKAAPYVFAGAAGLWMGIAVAGAVLPAIAFAAVVVMLFIAAK